MDIVCPTKIFVSIIVLQAKKIPVFTKPGLIYPGSLLSICVSPYLISLNSYHLLKTEN